MIVSAALQPLTTSGTLSPTKRQTCYEFPDSLKRIGDTTWQTACDARKKRSKVNDVISNCLVIYKDTFGHLSSYRLQIAQNSTVSEISQLDIIGDQGNPAAFFAQHCLPYRQPINNLKLLAGYTVLAGHRFNSAGISGLDILMFPKNGNVVFSTEDEDSPLQKKAHEIDQQIKALLFGSPAESRTAEMPTT